MAAYTRYACMYGRDCYCDVASWDRDFGGADATVAARYVWLTLNFLSWMTTLTATSSSVPATCDDSSIAMDTWMGSLKSAFDPEADSVHVLWTGILALDMLCHVGLR